MGEHNRPITCPWCPTVHGRRFLCDSAMAVLSNSIQRGESLNMPTVALDQPVPYAANPDTDKLIAQIVVKGATIPDEAGVFHPALLFTGRDVHYATLPTWIHPNDDEHLRTVAPLVAEMTELAIRQADQQNRSRS